MHVRQQIRNAFVTTLTGATDAGSNVFSYRLISHDHDVLPSLNVVILNESSEYHNQHEDLQREAEVVVEARVKSTDYESDAEDLCEQVETALAADITLGGIAKRLELVATNFQASSAGEQKAVLVALTYSVRYITNAATPGTAI